MTVPWAKREYSLKNLGRLVGRGQRLTTRPISHLPSLQLRGTAPETLSARPRSASRTPAPVAQNARHRRGEKPWPASPRWPDSQHASAMVWRRRPEPPAADDHPVRAPGADAVDVIDLDGPDATAQISPALVQGQASREGGERRLDGFGAATSQGAGAATAQGAGATPSRLGLGGGTVAGEGADGMLARTGAQEPPGAGQLQMRAGEGVAKVGGGDETLLRVAGASGAGGRQRSVGQSSVAPGRDACQDNERKRECELVPLQLVDIAALGPDQCRWKIRGRCTRKGELRMYRLLHGSIIRSLISFVLTDTTGSIRCTAYYSWAEKVDKMVVPGRVYEVSKCELTVATGNTGSGFGAYEILLDFGSSLQQRLEDESFSLASKSVFRAVCEQPSTCDDVERKERLPAVHVQQQTASSGDSGPVAAAQASSGEVVLNSHFRNPPSSNYLETVREVSRAGTDAGPRPLSDPCAESQKETRLPQSRMDTKAGPRVDGDQCRDTWQSSEVKRCSTVPETPSGFRGLKDSASRAAVGIPSRDSRVDTVDGAEKQLADAATRGNVEPLVLIERQSVCRQMRNHDTIGFDGTCSEPVAPDAMVPAGKGTNSEASRPGDECISQSPPESFAVTDALVDGGIFMGCLKLLAGDRCQCPCCARSVTRLSISRHLPCNGTILRFTSEIREAANALSRYYYPKRKRGMSAPKRRNMSEVTATTEYGIEILRSGRVKCPAGEVCGKQVWLSELDAHCRSHVLSTRLKEGVSSLVRSHSLKDPGDAFACSERSPMQTSNDRLSIRVVGHANNPSPEDTTPVVNGTAGAVGVKKSSVECSNSTSPAKPGDDVPEFKDGRESLKRDRDVNAPVTYSKSCDLPQGLICCPECTMIVDKEIWKQHCELFHDAPAMENLPIGFSDQRRDQPLGVLKRADADEDKELHDFRAQEGQQDSQSGMLKRSPRRESDASKAVCPDASVSAHAASRRVPPVSLRTQTMMIACGLKVGASGKFECPAPNCDAQLKVQSLYCHSRSYCKTFEMMEESLRLNVNELIRSVAKDRSNFRHRQSKENTRTHLGDCSSDDKDLFTRRAKQRQLSRARSEKGRSEKSKRLKLSAKRVGRSQWKRFSSEGQESPQLSTGSSSSASEVQSSHPSLLMLEPRLVVCPSCRRTVLARHFPKLLESEEHEACKDDIMKEPGLYEAIVFEARKYEDLKNTLSASLAEKERRDPTLAQAYEMFQNREASRSPWRKHDEDSAVVDFSANGDHSKNPGAREAPKSLVGTRNSFEASAIASSSDNPALAAASPSANISGRKVSDSPHDGSEVAVRGKSAGEIDLERATVSQVIASEHACPKDKPRKGMALFQGAMGSAATGNAMKKCAVNSGAVVFDSEKSESCRITRNDVVVCPAPRCRKRVPVEMFGSHLYSDNCQSKDSLTNEEFVATERALSDSYNLRFLGIQSDFF